MCSFFCRNSPCGSHCSSQWTVQEACTLLIEGPLPDPYTLNSSLSHCRLEGPHPEPSASKVSPNATVASHFHSRIPIFDSKVVPFLSAILTYLIRQPVKPRLWAPLSFFYLPFELLEVLSLLYCSSGSVYPCTADHPPCVAPSLGSKFKFFVLDILVAIFF